MTEAEYNARKSEYWLAEEHPEFVHALDAWTKAEAGEQKAKAWARVEQYLKENLK